MQLKAKHSNSDNHQTMIHMTNHRPLHNDIYHYVSHHTMIAIHISVTVNKNKYIGNRYNLLILKIHEVLILHQVLPLFFSVTTAVTPAELHLMTFQGDTPVNSQLLLKE